MAKLDDPTQRQGAIILEIGDKSEGGTDIFEGCITTGYATTATDDGIRANIAAAGCGE